MRCRSKAELLVAGVKVATQTPPIRSGRRVIFVTLDDATGPVDATFFEDAQGPYAATLFHSWLLVIRGQCAAPVRAGVSLRATGCWELPALHDAWRTSGLDAVAAADGRPGRGHRGGSRRRGREPVVPPGDEPAADWHQRRPTSYAGWHRSTAGGMGQRRVLVHPSGFRQSPYADIKPPGGEDTKKARPRKLWHSSPGSAGG